MSWDMLCRIQNEATLDFSAQHCVQARLEDLSPDAIETLRQKWFTQSKKQSLLGLSVEQLLSDAGLITEGKVSYAALILLAKEAALARHLPNSEIIFEYRNSEASRSYQQRLTWRQGLLSVIDALWTTVNLRNDV